ncbi:HEPN domain-containing protein [Prosthecobacter sp.]|uniref:HEPN domain-containing protein n=1 Tax=Prosthecobacter sp. TaxID=1965333 RepID=UPI001DE0ED62|nr:HEPN domain-containing protein [Prosthecobacter sp.]MCB1275040.1 hypothetical protein [Prosthecobacter sp.]
MIGAVDETVEFLNRCLNPSFFKRVTLIEMSQRLRQFYDLPWNTLELNETEISMSLDFHRAWMHHSCLRDLASLDRGYLMFLISPFVCERLEEHPNDLFNKYGSCERLTHRVIRALRLLKEGDFCTTSSFALHPDSGRSGGTMVSAGGLPHETRSFSPNDCELFERLMQIPDQGKESYRTALDFFEASFRTSGINRFLMLVTTLEAILNSGKDQIRQTFSRHGALIMAAGDLERFRVSYKLMKKAYDVRSELVHGGAHKSVPPEVMNAVSECARKALVMWISNPVSKHELSERFIEMGFSQKLF